MGETPRRRGSKGSTLILVVVALVLMAILGAVYLQLVRVDRIATHQANRSNINLVVDATIAQVQGVLRDDLLDDDGNFFNEDAGDAGGGDEPYDYPWTNSAVTFPVDDMNGNPLGNAQGGEHDDMWLASLRPDFDTDPAKPRWPHITNLNGIFLRIPKSGGSEPMPEERAVTLGGYLNTDTNVSGTIHLKITGDSQAMDYTGLADWEPWGADADGDGVPDSRWTWAPIRKIGNVMYVMAVRIVDNSAMVNANVALSQVSSAETYDGFNDAPRWWYPSELDLGNFVYTLEGGGAELRDLLEYRLGAALGSTLVPWGEVVQGQRGHFWLNGASMYGHSTPYPKLDIRDELELRHRNGLNDPDARATVEDATNGMDGFLRAGAASEVTYTDVAASMEDYFHDEPRHQMTALSGAAIFRPTLDGETGTGVQDKIDLNVADADELASEIEGVCTEGAAGMTPPPSITSQAGWTQADFARQFAACIKDYIDDDNRLTLVGPAGGERCGMEALPFIGEIYIQARWVITSSVLVTPPDLWRITWGQEGATGFVIEVRNPFRRRIWLKDVHLWVDGTDWGPLYDPDDASGRLTDIDALGPGEVLLLYNHSHNGTGDDDVAALIATEAGYTNRPVDIRNKLTAKGVSWPGAVGGGQPKVELRAMDQAGNALPWGYCVVPTHAVDTEPVTENVTSAGDPQAGNPVLYRQYWTVGNGNRLNAMLVKPGDFGQAWYAGIGWALVGRPREAGLDRLGEHDKTGLQAVYDPPYQDPPDDLVDADRNQVVIADRGKLTQVGELGQIAIFGPRPPAVLGGDPVTAAEAWAGVTDASDQMLNFAASDLVGPLGTYPSLEVPHAVLLLDRFTTLSPLVDGLDNDNADSDEDGQSADDVYEQLVPGTINLNTAPRELLEMVLPIPDVTTRMDVVGEIVGFRDMTMAPYNDGKRGTGITGYRDQPGIAMTGELMLCLRDIFGNDGGDNSTLGGTAIDFNWDPTTSTEAADTDGIVDDREEQAMVASWLSQVASTRSDVFTAYVVILGYPASDFRKGAVESARFIAVFDRSGITGPDDAVRVVGVQRLD